MSTSGDPKNGITPPHVNGQPLEEIVVQSSFGGRDNQTMSLKAPYVPDGLGRIITPPTKGLNDHVTPIALSHRVVSQTSPFDL